MVIVIFNRIAIINRSRIIFGSGIVAPKTASMRKPRGFFASTKAIGMPRHNAYDLMDGRSKEAQDLRELREVGESVFQAKKQADEALIRCDNWLYPFEDESAAVCICAHGESLHIGEA